MQYYVRTLAVKINPVSSSHHNRNGNYITDQNDQNDVQISIFFILCFSCKRVMLTLMHTIYVDTLAYANLVS